MDVVDKPVLRRMSSRSRSNLTTNNNNQDVEELSLPLSRVTKKSKGTVASTSTTASSVSAATEEITLLPPPATTIRSAVISMLPDTALTTVSSPQEESQGDDDNAPDNDDADDEGDDEEEEVAPTIEEEETSYDEQLIAMESKKRALLNNLGQQPAFQSLEQEKAHGLKTADLHQTLQDKNNLDFYTYNIQRAEDLYQNEVTALKKVLRVNTEKRMAILRAKLAALVDTSPTPPEKDTTTMDVEDHPNGNASSFPLALAASRTVIVEDLQLIYKDWHTLTESCPPVQAAISHRAGKLLCASDTYEVGDTVHVTSKFSGEMFEGAISSVTAVAVTLTVGDGTKLRVYLDHLRSQRCVIAPRIEGRKVLSYHENTGWIHP